MVGVWEGLNLGSIPNDHMPSQKDPKISIERSCSTILPILVKGGLSQISLLGFVGICQINKLKKGSVEPSQLVAP